MQRKIPLLLCYLLLSTPGSICTLGWASNWSKDIKPKYGPEATPLSISHAYFQKNPAPLFWSLIPYYLPQRDDRSCSLAAVSMVINAARAGTPLMASQALVTQDHLFKKVNSPVWNRGLGMLGHGVNLEQMGRLIEESFKAYQIPNVQIQVFHWDSPSPEKLQKLEKSLQELEKSDRVLIAANFLQGNYTGDADVGHFAPISAYDSELKRVLVMDPDREWYEPYWVSLETFAKGMATKDKGSRRNRGYVLINLPERQSPEKH